MASVDGLVPLACHQQPMMGPNTSAEAKPGVEVTGVEVTKRAPRVPWSPSEDYLLMCMVKGKGAHDWEEISTIVGRRSAKQCRERWHQNINPQLNRSPITREEGEVILDWVAQKGPQWAEIGRYLKNRSDNAVKNWYNAMIRRSERSQKAVTSRTTKKTRHTSRRSNNLSTSGSQGPKIVTRSEVSGSLEATHRFRDAGEGTCNLDRFQLASN